MNVLSPKNAVDRSTSTPVRAANGPHRSRPVRCAAAAWAALSRRCFRSSTKQMSAAGGRNSAVAGRPSAIRAGVASAGARKKPTLPPAANRLIAAALSPASWRAALPAAGWNMEMPIPDSRIAHHTAP